MTVPFRILSLLLCLLIAGPMSTPAWALARPETRVGNFFPTAPKSAPADLNQTLEPRRESRGCGYDFTSGVCKYLYTHGNPVNGVDPSGHEFSLTSLNTSIATGLRISVQVGVRAGRGLVKARRFFWDNRKFDAVRKAYWKANGPANGRSLHHWLIPQKMARIHQGLRNAGFNLLEMPKVLTGNLGLNQWIGFAVKWGGYRMVVAYTVENGIRIAIPLSIYEAATIGNENTDGEPVVEQFELKPSDWEDDRGFEDLRELTADDMDEDPMLGPGLLNQPQP